MSVIVSHWSNRGHVTEDNAITWPYAAHIHAIPIYHRWAPCATWPLNALARVTMATNCVAEETTRADFYGLTEVTWCSYTAAYLLSNHITESHLNWTNRWQQWLSHGRAQLIASRLAYNLSHRVIFQDLLNIKFSVLRNFIIFIYTHTESFSNIICKLDASNGISQIYECTWRM